MTSLLSTRAFRFLRLACISALGVSIAAGNSSAQPPPTIAPLPPVTGVLAGSLKGEFKVGSFGNATYSMPIAVPPGTNGMAPQLEFSYDSNTSSGTMGPGWSVSGLSSITRCAPTLAQDGFMAPVSFGATDKFCLDGQKLIAVSGTYGASGTQYRTAIETFAKVVSYDQSGTGPAYFVVYQKNGTKYEYGNSPDSRLQSEGQAGILSWKLNRISDRIGNRQTIAYQQDLVNGDNYPVRIDYTINEAAGLTAYNSVRFEYIAAPASEVKYLSGSAFSSRNQLKKVRMFTGEILAWEYRLNYHALEPATGESRLSAIEECDEASQCLPASLFFWAPGNGSGSLYNSFSNPSNLIANGSNTASVTGDWNGDGKIDFAQVTRTGISPYVTTSTGFTTFPGTTNSTIANAYMSWYPVVTGDWNGDGYTDLGRPSPDGYTYFFTSNGTSFTSMTYMEDFAPAEGFGDQNTNPFMTGDWNGDGRTDIARVHTLGIRFYVSTGTGFTLYYDLPQLSPNQGYAGNHSWPIVTGDWNGDGLTDIARTGDAGLKFFINTGTSFVSYTTLGDFGRNQGYANIGSYPIITGDWNSDGITDVARVFGGGVRFYQLKGNGSFSTARDLLDLSPGQGFSSSDTYPLFTGDWNGDGITDIGRVTSSGMQLYTQKAGVFTSLGIAINNLSPAQGFTNGTVAPLLLGDWDGDGITDIGRTMNTSLTSFVHTPTKSNLLNYIIDGAGKVIQLSFKYLSNNLVYARGTGAVYPRTDLNGPIPVVSDVATTDGIGGYAWIFYHYSGLRAELNGRGISGFQQIDAQDYNTGLTTSTKYRQDFPFSGQAYEQTVSTAGGSIVSRNVDTWTQRVLPGGSVYPYVSRNVVTTNELDGSFSKSVTKDFTLDNYGNPTQVVVSYSDTSTETTVNTFTNDETNWILGQLTSGQVTKTSSDSSALPTTRSAAYSYYPTSALLQSETIEPGNSNLTLTKTYLYDAFGNVRSLTFTGAGFSSRTDLTTYDTKGRWPVTLVNALNQTETRDYDVRHGKMTRQTGPNLLTTQWSYDAFGRVTNEYRVDGNRKRTVYFDADASAPPNASYYIREDVSGEPPNITYYDTLMREIQKIQTGFDGRKILVDTVYDNRGQVSNISEPYFAGSTPLWTTTEHDVIGRVTRIIAPGNRQTVMSYHGLTTSVTNPLQQIRTQVSDAQGNTLSVSDNANSILRYHYDGYGNVVKTDDPAGNITWLFYDVRGNKTRIIDPDTKTTVYTYDALGQLLTQMNAKSETQIFNYDKLGRMIQRQSPEGIETWTYDSAAGGVGKLAAMQGLNGYRQTLAYDSLGRPVATIDTISGRSYTLSQNYDQYSRLQTLTYPSGFSVKHVYNSYGYLSQVQRGTDGFVYWRADARNARKQLERQTLGNGLVTNRTYTPTNGLVETIVTGEVQNLSFQFDAVGNLNQRRDIGAGLTENFLYDGLNRVTQSQVAGRPAITSSYNSIGNITYRSDVGTYTYAQGNAGPHAVTSISGVQSNTYGYDATGNRISSVGGSAVYNSSGRPIEIIQGSNKLQFSLNPNGERVEERTYTGTALTSRKAYIGVNFERIDSGKSVQERHYIRGADGPVAIYTTKSAITNVAVLSRQIDALRAGQTRYLHEDHLGSVQSISDEDGRAVEVLSYDGWGKRRDAQTWAPPAAPVQSSIERGFTGHEHLDAVGLIHMNGRVYDPAIGRFISPDPFIQSPFNLQSLNRYSYALNNPLSFTDPSGFFLRGFFRALGRFFRQALPILLSIALAAAGQGWLSAALLKTSLACSTFWAPLIPGIAGAGTGFGVSIVETVTHGGSLMEGITAGFRGGPLNFVRALVASEIGAEFGTGGEREFGRVMAHGVSGGAFSAVQGSNFVAGFAGGAAGAVGDSRGIAVSALLGGTASALSGGKFADGAMQATVGYLYNWTNHGGSFQVWGFPPGASFCADPRCYQPQATTPNLLDKIGGFVTQYSSELHIASGALKSVGDDFATTFGYENPVSAYLVSRPLYGAAFILEVWSTIGQPPTTAGQMWTRGNQIRDLGKAAQIDRPELPKR